MNKNYKNYKNAKASIAVRDTAIILITNIEHTPIVLKSLSFSLFFALFAQSVQIIVYLLNFRLQFNPR